jgi:hypothetical protein
MDWTHEQGFLYALVCVNVRHSQGMDATKGFITVYAPLRAMAPTLADGAVLVNSVQLRSRVRPYQQGFGLVGQEVLDF